MFRSRVPKNPRNQLGTILIIQIVHAYYLAWNSAQYTYVHTYKPLQMKLYFFRGERDETKQNSMPLTEILRQEQNDGSK